jgi:hypothetical protein
MEAALPQENASGAEATVSEALDAKVARLLGWADVRLAERPVYNGREWVGGIVGRRSEDAAWIEAVPRYSGDWKEAGLLVEDPRWPDLWHVVPKAKAVWDDFAGRVVASGHTVAEAVARAFVAACEGSEVPPEASAAVERYEHHGGEVWVRADLKGRHREHCLCYRGCPKFKPGEAENCEIADAVYQNCVTFNVVTPVWECPVYGGEVEANAGAKL